MIVVGRDASSFDRWVAGELQRYVKQLSGAELPIVAERQGAGPKAADRRRGPASNPLAAAAQEKQLATFRRS